MNKIRIRFIRGEQLKFISHLDMLKLFDRAVRRAGIPITYSEGFNPHARMQFALPLPVGVTSDWEYADFETKEGYSAENLKNMLNRCLPEGIAVIEASNTQSGKSLMSLIAAAAYIICIESQTMLKNDEAEGIINSVMESSDIFTCKKTKHGVKQINIRPMIYKLWFNSNETLIYYNDSPNAKYIYKFGTVVSSGSEKNLNPMLLAGVLIQYLGRDSVVYNIHRTGLYVDKNGEKTPMDALNKEKHDFSKHASV